jgi:pimeloyl-ACP methyl ester carboxylesterase
MKFNFLKSFLIMAVLGFAQLSLAKEVVVLVPGFFNTFAPEYFSQTIVDSFKQKGFEVYVIDCLNPVGYIEENGARLESRLAEIEKIENRRVSFNIVAHSAGGFYSMWVANRQKFDIKNIIAVSTPFRGVEFVKVWLDNSFLFRTVMTLAHLESLKELTPEGADKFIKSVRIHPKTKMFAFGGTQSAGLDITDARNLSVPLRVTDHYTTGKSDGIVGFASAMGIGQLQTTDNKVAQQFRNPEFNINLEHWEQVLDYRSFVLLGSRNIGYIKNEQNRFYSGIANFLLTQLK